MATRNGDTTLIDMKWNAPEEIAEPCPMCNSTGPHRQFVHVEDSGGVVDQENSWKCKRCDGFFAWPFAYPDYEDDYNFKDYFRYYCEIGAGIDSIFAPIQDAVRARPVRSMIDIGCGVPFSTDFARRHLHIDAYGIDPSAYARAGSALLDTPVDFRLLGSGSQFDGQKFDLVYSTEVIEHVPDPQSFLNNLARHVNEDGVLVITTPNANFVGEGGNILDNLSVIWPGIHHAIFSAFGLKRLLIAAGFKYVDVLIKRERLISYAANTPHLYSTNPAKNRIEYEEYIENSISRCNSDSFSLKAGHLFRILRDKINFGLEIESRSTLQQLRSLCLSQFDCDVTDCRLILNDIRIHTEEGFFAKWPYMITVLPYYCGMLEMMSGGKPMLAQQYFTTQVEIIENMRFTNALWWSEAAHLYQTSLFHAGLATLVSGDHNRAEAIFSDIVDEDLARRPVFARYGGRDRQFTIRAMIQRGVCKLQTGRMTEAARDFTIAYNSASQSPALPALLKEVRSLQGVTQQQN